MHRTIWTVAATAILTAGALGMPPPALAGTAAMPSDFNGDGVADLAIGAPFEDVGGSPEAGAVTVLYGSTEGVTSAGAQRWTQDSPGVAGRTKPRGADLFGSALASADFDLDGFADLAVGVPLDRVGDVRFAGAVNVLYGSSEGLTADGDARFTQADVGQIPERRDEFGSALAAGDVNGDGYPDLAVGAPWEELGGIRKAGIVHVIFGAAGGLTTAGAITLERAMVVEGASGRQYFGGALAIGDFQSDGIGDLAVGAPRESQVEGGGDVLLFEGGPGGPSPDVAQQWSQDSPGMEDAAETGDAFGWVLAVGDFEGDGYADLAVGVPGENPSPCDPAIDCYLLEAAGAVSVIRGSATGLTATGNRLLHQGTPGVPGEPRQGQGFGRTLAAGDLDGDGDDELVVGVPHAADGGASESGIVVSLPGTVDGLDAAQSVLWSQDTAGVPGNPAHDDWFGMALAVAAFGRSNHDDLAIGVPGDTVDGHFGAGTVVLLYGSASGLDTLGAQRWTQASPGVPGSAETGDGFGLRFPH